MKKTIAILFILFVSQISSAQQKTIVGKISGLKNNTKVKLFDQELMEFVDSTYIQNAGFVLKNPFKDPAPRNLKIVIFDSFPKFLKLYVSNENVVISGDINDFPYDIKIVGSKTQNDLNNLNFKTKSLQKERDEIVKFWKTEVKDKNDSYRIQLEESRKRAKQIDSLMDSITKNHINSNINSFFSLNQLTYFKTKYTTSELQYLYSKLDSKYKKSKDGISLLNYIEIGNVLKVNDHFSDFEAFDNKGIKHKLSDFKGNFILLDFTKEFCEPCEKAIKELKIINQKYSDEITIISFTGEKSEEFWKKGILRNSIQWLSLWDGNGAKGKTLMKYDVHGFPNFFLINKEGKIIEIIEGYSEGILETKVEKLLKG